jgi:hypothetical protein
LQPIVHLPISPFGKMGDVGSTEPKRIVRVEQRKASDRQTKEVV